MEEMIEIGDRTADQKNAYWEGYYAGTHWHMGSGPEPENPYTDERLAAEYEDGLADAAAEA